MALQVPLEPSVSVSAGDGTVSVPMAAGVDRGMLERELDRMHAANERLVKSFWLYDDLFRRSGGQGVVQVPTPPRQCCLCAAPELCVLRGAMFLELRTCIASVPSSVRG